LTFLKGNVTYQESMLQRMRWVMWLLLILLHLVTYFHRVSFNVVADLLTAEFTLTGAGLGNLAAAYTYMYVLMQIPGGVLVDRLGPRRIALLTGLAMALGSIVIAMAPGSAFIFLGRLLIGFGGSMVLINIFKFQATWFRATEFATLSGLAILFSGSGAVLAATPLAYMVNLAGWRTSFLSVGLATVFIALICWFFVRSSPRELYPGIAGTSLNNGGAEKAPGVTMRSALKVLANRRLWSPFIINFGTFSGYIVFSGTWGISYLVHVYGISVEQASGFMTAAFLGHMIGAPAAGIVSDRMRSRRIPALVLVSCCVLFWLVLVIWPGGLLPLGLLYGFSALLGFGAACTLLSFPMAREVSPPGFTGSVTAAVNLGVFLGLAILQPLFGYVLDLGWEGLLISGARIYPLQAYKTGFLVSLLFAVMALFAALAYRDKKLESG
jgi:sugar phosphate permease